jgi:two-component system, chemotaxis family, sensor kinase CheA
VGGRKARAAVVRSQLSVVSSQLSVPSGDVGAALGLMVAGDGPDKGKVDELTREFIAESQEGLERMEFCLTELEKRPGERELVAEIFRAVHTIKGTTGFLGFGRLEKLAHAGEHLLGAVRDGKVTATADVINGLLDLMDGLRAILRLIETTGSEGVRARDEDSRLIAMLGELKAGGVAGAATTGVGAPASLPPPAVAPAQVERRVEKAAAQAASPVLDAAPIKTAPVASDAAGAPAAATVPAPPAAVMPDKSLRIDVEVLNRMMNLVGELVLTRNQILQCTPGAKNFPELARRLDSVTAELRESVMEARMQPVGHLFGKFPRMVRDLARTCGRQVRIEFEGQETGLDKSLLEAIRDPLTHAVRNSVDHGIEPAEERVKAGKAAEGVLRLRAFHQSGWVVIEVIDDGAGISTDRVRAKAIERGLATAEQAAAMSEREALQLVFVAGFSTAKQVTNVSGRGVGMDVVRANVEKVGGSVDLESRVGVGTTLRLRVPLTLAIVPALVVRSGGVSFALPQNALAELVYVTQREAEGAIERIGTAELYRLRERLLPLVWLDRLLELEQRRGDEEQGFYIAVVESEGRRFGLVVDDLLAPEEIVVKPLSAALREIGMFSGATVLGNGMLALILDVAATGSRAGVRPITDVEKSAGTEAEAGRTRVREADGRVAAFLGAEPGQAQFAMERSMVIFEVRAGERMAIPLSQVERIEFVPMSEVEFAGGRALLQYRGEVLALEDEGGVLGSMGGSGQGAASESGTQAATVLVCRRMGAHGAGTREMRRVGVVVRRVLDITAGTLLAEDAWEFGGQLAMVRDRVTTVHRDFAAGLPGQVAAMLQEVA